MSDKVRLNADIAPDVADALVQLADDQHISLADALRRAISTEVYLQKERDRGSKIFLEREGVRQEVIFRL
jgi:hypothetical protein